MIFHDLKKEKSPAPFEFSEEHVRDLSVSMKLRVWSFELGGRSNNSVRHRLVADRFLCCDFRTSCRFSEECGGRKNHRVWRMYGIDDQQTQTSGQRKHLAVEENEN